MTTLSDAFATTVKEDAPVNTNQSYTSAGELRLFGFSHIPYETFMVILVFIAALFITLKIVLHKRYKEKGMPIHKKS
ncbi:MAG: hypothetical protein ACK4NC_01460 [Candidatus Gracilibacteria bacterium]